MAAYYNEFDSYAAQWLRNLIKAGHIAPGDVDERPIQEVKADEIKGYTQCHFFAGIGGWSRALRLALWPDDRPVWTGSPPCQPFSVASVAHGGAKGQGDERDLWPHLFQLIAERRPPTFFGEQVANAIGWGWWDRAAMDFEKAEYACAAVVLRSDAFKALHERKRLYFVAHASGEGRQRHKPHKRISLPAAKTFPLTGDPHIRARAILAGDYTDLLLDDGVSIAVERAATKGYGNAIVAQTAAEFIRAAMI